MIIIRIKHVIKDDLLSEFHVGNHDNKKFLTKLTFSTYIIFEFVRRTRNG